MNKHIEARAEWGDNMSSNYYFCRHDIGGVWSDAATSRRTSMAEEMKIRESDKKTIEALLRKRCPDHEQWTHEGMDIFTEYKRTIVYRPIGRADARSFDTGIKMEDLINEFRSAMQRTISRAAEAEASGDIEKTESLRALTERLKKDVHMFGWVSMRLNFGRFAPWGLTICEKIIQEAHGERDFILNAILDGLTLVAPDAQLKFPNEHVIERGRFKITVKLYKNTLSVEVRGGGAWLD